MDHKRLNFFKKLLNLNKKLKFLRKIFFIRKNINFKFSKKKHNLQFYNNKLLYCHKFNNNILIKF